MEKKPHMLTDREADMLRKYALERLRQANARLVKDHYSANLIEAQELHDLSERLRG